MTGNLPDSWQWKSLREVATINYGKSASAILSDEGEIPVVGTGGVERYGSDYLYDGASIILGRKGTIDKVSYIDGRFWPIDTAYYLNAFQEGARVRWLYYFLQTVDLRSLNEATGVPSLSRELLYKIMIPTPCPEEQEKIAEILATLDLAIEQTEALIAKQHRIKVGLMQDLLTKGIDEHGNIRSETTHAFKDSPLGRIPVEWSVSSLGAVAKFQSGYAFKNQELTETGLRVVRISNLHKEDFPYWHYDGSAKETWFVHEGDILFSWAGVASSIVCVRYIGASALLNQHIYNLVIPDEALRTFVYYSLQSYLPKLRTEIEGGAGQLHLTKGKIQSIVIPEPGNAELTKIIETMEKEESMLSVYKKQLSKAKSLKSGLMHDLLIGTRRVMPSLAQAAKQ
jgi:type I restriction enzyme S subunit